MYWWYSKIAIHQFYVNINERTIQLWRADIADSLKEISFSSRTEHSAIYDYSVNTLEERAGHGAAAPGPPGLLPVQVVCTRGLGEALPGHEVHHGGLAGGEAERGERHVAVEEPALVDQPEDLRFRHLQQHTSESGQAAHLLNIRRENTCLEQKLVDKLGNCVSSVWNLNYIAYFLLKSWSFHLIAKPSERDWESNDEWKELGLYSL